MTLTAGVSYIVSVQQVQALGTPADLAGFTFTPSDFRCVDTPPDDPDSSEDDHFVRPSQTCSVRFSVRNNQRRVATTAGLEALLRVGENEYTPASINGGMYVSELLPDASAAFRASFIVPPNVAPTVLVVENTLGFPGLTDKTEEFNVQS